MDNISENIEVSSSENTNEGEVLVVTSKVKKAVKAMAGMNTSGDFSEALSAVVKAEIVKAIAKAKEAGRKTVMARDIC